MQYSNEAQVLNQPETTTVLDKEQLEHQSKFDRLMDQHRQMKRAESLRLLMDGILILVGIAAAIMVIVDKVRKLRQMRHDS